MWTRGLGTRLDPAALDEVDRRVEDHLIARLNAVARLDLRSEIARHRYLSNMRDTILDHGDVQPIAVEDACVRRREPLRFRETESMRSSHRMFTGNLSANRTMSDRPASKPLRKRAPFRRQGRQSFRVVWHNPHAHGIAQRTYPQRVILFQRGAAGLPRRAPFEHRPRFYSDWPYSAMQDRYI